MATHADSHYGMEGTGIYIFFPPDLNPIMERDVYHLAPRHMPSIGR
jgi:hypothetical protein